MQILIHILFDIIQWSVTAGSYIEDMPVQETDLTFSYLILELGERSVHQYVIERKLYDNFIQYIPPRLIICETTEGVRFLHSINILHRDLTPHNLLITRDVSGKVRIKIGDLGNSDILSPQNNWIATNDHMVGYNEWTAPEALKGAETSRPGDVFSLGLIFYFVLSEGSHPFGKFPDIILNIQKGDFTLHELKQYEDIYLFSQCISCDPRCRPTAAAILDLPAFWDADKQLAFLCCVADKLKRSKEEEREEKVNPERRTLTDARSLAQKNLDKDGPNWGEKLSEAVRNEVKDYDFTSRKELLRCVRNLKNHYYQKPVEVQAALGAIPDEFLKHFTTKFPELITYAFESMREIGITDQMFSRFYTPEIRTWLGNLPLMDKKAEENTEKKSAAITSNEEADRSSHREQEEKMTDTVGVPDFAPDQQEKNELDAASEEKQAASMMEFMAIFEE